jgi:hypothetical protein
MLLYLKGTGIITQMASNSKWLPTQREIENNTNIIPKSKKRKKKAGLLKIEAEQW